MSNVENHVKPQLEQFSAQDLNMEHVIYKAGVIV